MAKSEVMERIELLEKLGALIRAETKAHGLITMIWGVAVFVGFLVYQVMVLTGFQWYFGVWVLAGLLTVAGVLTGYFRRRFGYSGGWLGRKVGAMWGMVVFGGGIPYMIIVFHSKLWQMILLSMSPIAVSGLILTGWLLLDGIGCMVQGVFLESRAYRWIGLTMCGAAVVVAYYGFIYAWLGFALTLGLGWILVGLKDYREFKKTTMTGVKVD